MYKGNPLLHQKGGLRKQVQTLYQAGTREAWAGKEDEMETDGNDDGALEDDAQRHVLTAYSVV